MAGKEGPYERFERETGEYWGAAYGLIYRMVRSKDTAEDVLQDTLIRAMKSYDKLRDADKVKSWLLRIAHNTTLNHLRRAKNTVPVDFVEDLGTLDIRDADSKSSPVEEAVTKKDEGAWVEKLIQRLPPIYTEIILLRYKEGLSYKELADTIGIPMSSVKFRLHQGVKLLKEKIGKKF